MQEKDKYDRRNSKNAINKKASINNKNIAMDKKKDNNRKSPNTFKNKSKVDQRSRRILKPSFGQQMVYIKKEKNAVNDRSQSILNLKNTGSAGFFKLAQQNFENVSETDFQGLSDDEKNVKNSTTKNFGMVFGRKDQSSLKNSESKR